VQKGLTESLAGRFETVRSTHWTFAGCRDAFGWDLDTFLFHGGYPGAARYVGDHDRRRAYILDAIVETTVSRDVLLLTRIDEPALLRRLFQLACDYSGQELSYRKMIGQLTDAGRADRASQRRLRDVLHLVREVPPRRRRRQLLAILAVQSDNLVHDPAQLHEHFQLVVSVAPSIQQTWGTAHVALVRFGPLHDLHVFRAVVHLVASSIASSTARSW
jgi:hypothetical protein